jgi:hypothetical protein
LRWPADLRALRIAILHLPVNRMLAAAFPGPAGIASLGKRSLAKNAPKE